MRLWAVSDLHLSSAANREALESFPALGEDWLILAGDIADGHSEIDRFLGILASKCGQVIWVPGNHELWTRPGERGELRGIALYDLLVDIARSHQVITPEDPFPVFPHCTGDVLIAPLFVHYDYSFRPAHVPAHAVINWARRDGTVCADEYYLHPDPFPSSAAWCNALCRKTETRLEACPADVPKVLVNHYPLEERLAVLPRIPRFTPWCGTKRTHGWHTRFNARAVIYGHLHIRGTSWLDGVPFQEVSLGYPSQWRREIGMAGYLQEVQLAPARPSTAAP